MEMKEILNVWFAAFIVLVSMATTRAQVRDRSTKVSLLFYHCINTCTASYKYQPCFNKQNN